MDNRDEETQREAAAAFRYRLTGTAYGPLIFLAGFWLAVMTIITALFTGNIWLALVAVALPFAGLWLSFAFARRIWSRQIPHIRPLRADPANPNGFCQSAMLSLADGCEHAAGYVVGYPEVRLCLCCCARWLFRGLRESRFSIEILTDDRGPRLSFPGQDQRCFADRRAPAVAYLVRQSAPWMEH